MRRTEQDPQLKVFYELSALVLDILRSPPTPIDFSDDAPVVSSAGTTSLSGVKLQNVESQQITPAGVSSLLLGISLTLMLCGSVTFFIGFMLMPWILGLVMVFYVVGLVSSLSMLGRYILFFHTSTSPSSSSSRNDCSSWKLL